MSRLVEIYGGADKVFLLQSGKIARMPVPKDETVTLCFTFEVGKYAKAVIDDSIAEFNEVFARINPHYTFAADYAPTSEILDKKFAVRVSASSSLEETDTREVFGLAHVSYYNNFTELGDFGITLKDEVVDNGSYLMTTFKHELMHLLGAGDAYKNNAATKDTVMQSYTVGGYHHFSKSDVALLDALYRNPSLDTPDRELQDYIDGYENTATHTRQNLTASVYNLLADGLGATDLIGAAEALGYKDLSAFREAVKDGIERDPAFGKESVSFTEIDYAEPQSETYFGSIDPENGRYWHGVQKGSLGNSQGIKYTDYGGGIVYAAPNGNLYTVMLKVDNFVLSFRLGGGFTDLTSLSLTLWHISRI